MLTAAGQPTLSNTGYKFQASPFLEAMFACSKFTTSLSSEPVSEWAPRSSITDKNQRHDDANLLFSCV